MSLCSFASNLLLLAGVRLRAAAGALFPPKGEEKKSKVEAERHRRQGSRPASRPSTPANEISTCAGAAGQHRALERGCHASASRTEHGSGGLWMAVEQRLLRGAVALDRRQHQLTVVFGLRAHARE
jgi:hypothetical protein